jgi:hypothetical protein
MAALAVSQQRASKNNLRGNFIELKRRQGFTVDFVDADIAVSLAGKELDGLGRGLAAASRVAHLLKAETLTRAKYESVEGRIQSNGDVSDCERWQLARTKIERFYREQLSERLIETDDRGRLRARIIRFAALDSYARTKEARERLQIRDIPDKYGIRARFLRDDRIATALLDDLLSMTPVFVEGRFDTEATFSFQDLSFFLSECKRLKPVIENVFELEVTALEKGAVKQLNAFLGLTGQRVLNADKFKASGETFYRYRLDREGLKRMQEIAARRRGQEGWQWINEHYGWTGNLDDE